MAKPIDIVVRLSDTEPWLRTMEAAVALLFAVEDADPALVPHDVLLRAAEMRVVFEDIAEGRG